MADNTDKSSGPEYKAVLYSDGGYYNSEKAGGWGVHGYIYTADDLPTKGSGHPKATPTANGYIDVKDEKQAVKVQTYIDTFGGVPQARSNNHTELLATKEALTYALDKGIHHTLIYSDSQYVVEGVNKYLNRWKTTGWRKRDGEEISNKEDWIAMDLLLNKFKETDTTVTLAWIKGHNGHAGNEMADQWAGKGNCIGVNGYSLTFKLENQPEGYWKTSILHNRMMDQPKWYFSSEAAERRAASDGRFVYWTGTHGDDEDTGKPQADSSNAVLYLKSQLNVLEKVRDHFIEKDKAQVGHLFVGALRNILNGNVTEDILKFGLSVFRKNKANMSLTTEKKVPVVHHVTPTGTAFYNIENLESMTVVLDQFMAGDKSVIVTDLTDLLYEATEKKGAVIRKLRKEITSAVKHLDVGVHYNTTFARELRVMDEVPVTTAKIRFIVGSDIIGRNALSALAETVKRVVALTWRESDTVIRYATVIETVDDIGIWANPFGNFKLVN